MTKTLRYGDTPGICRARSARFSALFRGPHDSSAPRTHSPSTVLVRVLGRRHRNTACARGRPNLRSSTDIPPSPSVSSAPVVPALRGWSRHQSRSSKTQTPPVRHNARHPASYPAPPAPLVPLSLTPTPSRCATVTAPPPHVSRNLA